LRADVWSALGKIDVLKRGKWKNPLKKKELVQAVLDCSRRADSQNLEKSFSGKIGVDYLFSQELDDLAKAGHDRWPIQSYFIRHGGHQEATGGDEKLRLLSAKKIWQRKIATMTSLEISQFSFEYVLASGVFTDVKSVFFGCGFARRRWLCAERPPAQCYRPRRLLSSVDCARQPSFPSRSISLFLFLNFLLPVNTTARGFFYPKSFLGYLWYK